MDYTLEYQRWLDNVEETDFFEELKNMNETAIEDAFYQKFGFWNRHFERNHWCWN